ncbi:Hypothetical protein NGAL_HAMBI1146_58360 [Neorhizobium galegae bv. officinalis]|nr:Hypothetical protein NGAL_HAMBI1146_58360 [Neorhizobium galegae bv. officinalis]
MLQRLPTCVACGQLITSGHLVIDPFTISMPRRVRRVLAALLAAKGAFLTTENLADQVYWDDPDGGPEGAIENIHSYVHKLRKIVSDRGVIIESSRFEGYRLVRAHAVEVH